jgi:DNA polymerase-1
MSAEEETILLIDLGSVIHPLWGATSSQFQTFVKTLHRVETMAENYKATIVCADSLRNWRHQVAESYKANRAPKMPEFLQTIADIKAKLIELEFPLIECDLFEADDVIATLVSQAFDPVHILTEDKDLAQLVTDSVSLLTKYGTINPAVCWRKFGVRPDQMRDYLTLVGDVADNVKGCPGVGLVAAAKLLGRFGSLEGVKSATPVELKKLRGVGETMIQNLTEWDPEPAYTLVGVRTDCPASLDDQLKRLGVAA